MVHSLVYVWGWGREGKGGRADRHGWAGLSDECRHDCCIGWRKTAMGCMVLSCSYLAGKHELHLAVGIAALTDLVRVVGEFWLENPW